MKLADLLSRLSPAARSSVSRQIGPAKPLILRRIAVSSMRESVRSPLEQRFLELWTLHQGPRLEEQYPFVLGRKFRADFAFVPAKLAIELDGGIWKSGGHNRGSGYKRDRRRDFEAYLNGWKILRLTGDMINGEHLTRLIKHLTDGDTNGKIINNRSE